MGTIVVRIDMPPVDAADSGGATSGDAQMQREEDARQKFLDFVEPKLDALAKTPPRRAGNIVHLELLGGSEWSRLNEYLLLVSTDIGESHVDWSELAPPGGTVSVVSSGPYSRIREWPHEVNA